MIIDIIIGITYISTAVLGGLILMDLMAWLNPKYRELFSKDDDEL